MCRRGRRRDASRITPDEAYQGDGSEWTPILPKRRRLHLSRLNISRAEVALGVLVVLAFVLFVIVVGDVLQ